MKKEKVRLIRICSAYFAEAKFSFCTYFCSWGIAFHFFVIYIRGLSKVFLEESIVKQLFFAGNDNFVFFQNRFFLQIKLFVRGFLVEVIVRTVVPVPCSKGALGRQMTSFGIKALVSLAKNPFGVFYAVFFVNFNVVWQFLCVIHE